ncbi:hypothetical protein COU49_01045 [Candidatus Nomurabacteria bacterium CG10_big_fil_rev_8_21_14_0_10_35_16]|uniref:Uncharacterized protein n=1 Tax=Candidatus Nomurabacteria bacterium CG10_big_fil_rev_8_21_14_0_10_35_16 TaxID=1974731 RepID=A0A2H0TDS2_9BACT|nr:MAG: hypothetical protein COU49_01045 [Candidatus Nomurabacteria bacterium CG10_big_fil_rev_8_21_14_0_10_35_16]
MKRSKILEVFPNKPPKPEEYWDWRRKNPSQMSGEIIICPTSADRKLKSNRKKIIAHIRSILLFDKGRIRPEIMCAALFSICGIIYNFDIGHHTTISDIISITFFYIKIFSIPYIFALAIQIFAYVFWDIDDLDKILPSHI